MTAVKYFEGVACFPDSDASNMRVQAVFGVSCLIFGYVLPLAFSVVTPVYCLCYISRHSISGDTGYKKAISRLALFLVTGSVVNLCGSLQMTVTVMFSYASEEVYLQYGVGLLSLFPTPILIIMFLKAVQGQMRAIITCHRSHSHQIQPQVPVKK